jgi:hypothetical protein
LTKDSSPSDPRDLGTQALEIAKRRQEAAKDVLALLEKHFEPAATRPETVLFAAAWLAGTSLFRSLGLGGDAQPGVVVLSEKANEEWPKLMKTFLYLLEKFGIQVKPEAATFKIPAEHQSQESLLQVQEALQAPYNEIMTKHGFDYAEGAKTGAVLCAMLVNAYCGRRKLLEPGLAAGIVSMGFVEGAKTVPAKLRTGG